MIEADRPRIAESKADTERTRRPGREMCRGIPVRDAVATLRWPEMRKSPRKAQRE
jgi:hypothetical protein